MSARSYLLNFEKREDVGQESLKRGLCKIGDERKDVGFGS